MQVKTKSEMTKDELIYLSRQFANMFGIPVRLYQDCEKKYFYSTIDLAIDPVNLCLNEILEEIAEVGYYIYDHSLYYGIVNYKQYKFIVGPVSELKLSDNQLKKLGLLLNIRNEDMPIFVSEMKTLSKVHLDTIIQIIILYNFTVNRTMYDISDIRIKNSVQSNISLEMKENKLSPAVDSNFYINNVRSFSIEKDIIKKVMQGDVDGLIEGATKIPSASSRHFAPHLLRHQKNFFIKLEIIVSRAAIEAGLDVEEVFKIEEMYITKCESLENVDMIKNLQYHMILDFADRVNKLHRYNVTNSKIVNKITNYIKNHISDPVKTSDIAEHLGKSRVRITTEFKKQTGMNLSDFVKSIKIREAEELLNETNNRLISISSYLGFSSQSHFCKVFKEVKGVTPTEYRNKK